MVHPLLRKILDPPLRFDHVLMSIAINHSSTKLSRIPYKPYNILILNKEGYPLTGAALCLRLSLDWVFTLEIRGFPAENVRKRSKF